MDTGSRGSRLLLRLAVVRAVSSLLMLVPIVPPSQLLTRWLP